MSNGKAMIIHLIVGSIKKNLYKKQSLLSQSYRIFGGDINVKVDLLNYATKNNLRKAAGVDTSNFVAKHDLSSLKDEIDKIDVRLLT